MLSWMNYKTHIYKNKNKNAISVEAEDLESKINKVIETAEGVIKELVRKKQMAANNLTLLHTPPQMTGQSTYQSAISPSSHSQHSRVYSQRLKLPNVSIFNGEKKKYEDLRVVF